MALLGLGYNSSTSDHSPLDGGVDFFGKSKESKSDKKSHHEKQKEKDSKSSKAVEPVLFDEQRELHNKC